MIDVNDEVIEAAKRKVAEGQIRAVGYRVLIYPLNVETKLTGELKKLAPTLAESGFQDKTQFQAERESKGTQFGILADVGRFAWGTELLGREPWAAEGDVVLFDKYQGVEFECRGKKFKLTNDEVILGKME